MESALDYCELADWRRRVAGLYAEVRAAPEAGRAIAWNEWRAGRNDLFQQHTQSPLTLQQRAAFRGLDYFSYDPSWRLPADLETDLTGPHFRFELGEDGDFDMKRIGWVSFTVGGKRRRLALYWIEGYGGGLFLPFKDLTNIRPPAGQGETYGGGRYLLDTIKGADLGSSADRLVLDFNYAYNPSCAYHPRWACPLAPEENTLPFAVTAGEKRYVAAA
ncbi:MAG: DUF1684 domain-containing protein [Chloroflexota bacterium]|jgi:hypothetical protein